MAGALADATAPAALPSRSASHVCFLASAKAPSLGGSLLGPRVLVVPPQISLALEVKSKRLPRPQGPETSHARDQRQGTAFSSCGGTIPSAWHLETKDQRLHGIIWNHMESLAESLFCHQHAHATSLGRLWCDFTQRDFTQRLPRLLSARMRGYNRWLEDSHHRQID